MGTSLSSVCLLLLTLSFCILKGYSQHYSAGAVELGNSLLDNRKATQVNQQRPANLPSFSLHDSSRLDNIMASKHRGEENNGSGASNSTSWSTIAYRVTMALFVGIGLLAALALSLKSLIMTMKQKKIQESFSMTYHDAKLSSQFLSDLSGSERSDSNNPNPPTKAITDKPAVIDIPTAAAPIPAQISVTSPKGETRKSTWQMDDFVQVDLSDDGMQSRARRTSSLPSLSSDHYSSSTESRDSSRRDAVLFISDDEDFLADLKKKSKKNKKTWKKIIKAGQLRAS